MANGDTSVTTNKQDMKAMKAAAKKLSGPRLTTLPIGPLLGGKRARRARWAKGVEVYMGEQGGRGGRQPALFITGSRAGDVAWTPELTGDGDLLAKDWMVLTDAVRAQLLG